MDLRNRANTSEDDNRYTKTADNLTPFGLAGEEWNKGRGDDLEIAKPLICALVAFCSAPVPFELVFETIDRSPVSLCLSLIHI